MGVLKLGSKRRYNAGQITAGACGENSLFFLFAGALRNHFLPISGRTELAQKDGAVVAEPTYGQAEEEIYQTGPEGLTDIGA